MKRCENQGKTANTRCDNQAVPGHIYCDPCRLTSGGYARYTSPPVLGRFRLQAQHSSNKQE